MQHTLIPTRQTVERAWSNYQALALAVAADPILADDPNQRIALDRAHARWAKVFVDWNGR